MALVDVMGWLATVITISIGLPQFIRLLRTRDASGIAIIYWQISFGTVACWLAHGVVIGQLPMIICNAGTELIGVFVCVMLIRTRGVPVWKMFLPGLGILAVMVTMDLVFGSLWFGIPVACLQCFSNAGQSVDLVRSPQVTGVSVLVLVLQNLNQVVWAWWAILLEDPGTILVCVATEVVVGFNLVWRLLRLGGLRAFRPYPPPAPRVGETARLGEGSIG
ncbi:MAG: hypothetical protein LBQ92_00860 [Propionibacteriaceae bacterium]|jgi:MtN3 and saliva related transmembrane protein|nr:hypothetical protein [Propionibacteriaceae bacterium]